MYKNNLAYTIIHVVSYFSFLIFAFDVCNEIAFSNIFFLHQLYSFFSNDFIFRLIMSNEHVSSIH